MPLTNKKKKMNHLEINFEIDCAVFGGNTTLRQATSCHLFVDPLMFYSVNEAQYMFAAFADDWQWWRLFNWGVTRN